MAENAPARNAQALHDPPSDAGPEAAVHAIDAEQDDDDESDPIEVDLWANPEPLSNPPALHPLLNKHYDSLEAIEHDLFEYGAAAGFRIVRTRSGNPLKGFGYTQVDYACQRGKIRTSTARSREPSTTKLGCPWQASVKALHRNGRKWTLELKKGCEGHENHSGDGFNSRPFLSPELKAYIATFLDRPGISNRELAVNLRAQFPEAIWTARQLRNYRFKLRKDALAGYTPFQATMKLLDDEGVSYHVKWAKRSPSSPDSEPRKPEGLFWSYEWSKKQWLQSPWVQLYDNTYKTNNKGLAFFQVVGLNHLGMAYSCGFGLINNERQEGFDWLMETVNAVRDEIKAKPPTVTITDYDKAMRAAVTKVYPLAKPQICIFHLQKNVTLHIKRKWNKAAAERVARSVGQPLPSRQQEEEEDLLEVEDQPIVDRQARPLDGQPGSPPNAVEYSMKGLYSLWQAVLYAYTVEEFDAAWDRLKAFFSHQIDILQYLEETWMPFKHEWAACYTNKLLNFGQRTTSPVESVNRYLKSFVINGNSTVLAVVRQSCRMVEAMEQRIDEALLKERNTLKRDFIGRIWLGKTPFCVSKKGLELVVKQWRITVTALPTPSNPTPPPLEPCTGQFTAQYGMPCSHTLFNRNAAKALPLVQKDFHPY